ncbi:MAG TPA: Yip1 family protein [Kofleriaceae bacterium]|nr:Yip1 family protein [Kofleriaceae bacterium]
MIVPDESFGPARPDRAARLRRTGAALVAHVRALLVPDRGVPPLVSAGRARLALALVVGAALLSAAALSARIDMGPVVRAQNAGGAGGPGGPGGGGGGGGPPGEAMTDTAIEEEIAKQTAIVEVKAWLDAGLGTPARIIGLAIALLVLGRYVGGKPTFQRALAAASVGALPWAVRSLIEAAALWRQERVVPDDLADLVAAGLPFSPDNPIAARLLSGDLFSLWSIVLVGFGLSTAAGIGRFKSFATVTVCYLLLVLVSPGAP